MTGPAGATTLLVHYQELALKGRNRPWFVNRLVRNLREVTAGLGVSEVRSLMGRIEIGLRPSARTDLLLSRVRRTLGVANVAVAQKILPDLDAIAASALALVAPHDAHSFRVRAVRADKAFPIPSPEIERSVGGRVKEVKGWRVDLDEPQLVVRVEIVPGAAYCSVERHRGPAGLPVGVSGRVACLLSGGIDSPVAAYRLMRRGCRVFFVHFHSYPITSTASQDKVRRLARVLTRYQLRSRLALVPFGEIQRRIVVTVPAALRVIAYRRFMMRIAERIARRIGARALVTGEVIGQVASQTLDNLSVVDAATGLPVLRPLIGMDKEDITAQAREIGTFDVSILPDEDCCQVFMPTRPATNARRLDVEQAEATLPVEEMIGAALDATVREEFAFADAAEESQL